MTTGLSLGTNPVYADSTEYWLKVNRRANVVNVYRKTNSDQDWEIFKVMLCSTGTNNGTPCGDYRVSKRWEWQPLIGGHYGYCTTQFYGDFLFHSVYYNVKGRHDTLLNEEFNKLGKQASLGCVRMCAMDAKWVYENCETGTKVTVYEDEDPGPLGKPKGIKVEGETGWDPTDPDENNPNFRMTGPEIIFDESKPRTITTGSEYDLIEGVSARNPYTYQDLTSKLEVKGIYKKNLSGNYVKVGIDELDTSITGEYKIAYYCYDEWCGKKTVCEKMVLRIEPPTAPGKMMMNGEGLLTRIIQRVR